MNFDSFVSEGFQQSYPRSCAASAIEILCLFSFSLLLWLFLPRGWLSHSILGLFSLSFFCSDWFFPEVDICTRVFSLSCLYLSSDCWRQTFATQSRVACLTACTFPDARSHLCFRWGCSCFCCCLAFLALLLAATIDKDEILPCVNNQPLNQKIRMKIKFIFM